MEQAAGVRYQTRPAHAGWTVATAPVLVRYADDFVVACHSQKQAEQVKARLAEWLAVRGLALNEDKTSITHARLGFDFLGFNIRRYPNGKLLIKPSKAAITRIRERLREVFRKMRGATTLALIQTLNPIISGWAAYYRTAVSSGAFSLLDDYVWKLALKWATHRHRNKPKKWIADRYFGRFHPHRKDRWVLGDRDSGVYLLKFSWTRIVRHQMVTAWSSPNDPALADYWASRRRKHKPPLGQYAVFQLQRQHGRCPLCGDYLLHADHGPASIEDWGAVVPRHPKGDQQAQLEDRRERGARHAGPGPDTPRTHPMSPLRSSRRHRSSTPARLTALAACLSRVRGNLHARF